MDYFIKNYRKVYFSVLAMGFFLISVFMLVTLFSDPENILIFKSILTLTLVGLMIFLGLIVYKKSRGDLVNTNDPNDFYYLGFIFTIYSLIAGFLPYAFIEGEVTNEKTVLSAFGLGMLTTFIGLAGRQVLFQLFDKPDDETENTRIRIQNKATQFSDNLQTLTERMNNNMNSFANEFEKANFRITEVSNKFSKQFEKVSSSLEGIENKFNAAINRFVSLADKKESDLLKFSDSLEKAGNSASVSLSKISTNAEKLNDGIQRIDLSVFVALNSEVSKFSTGFSSTLKELTSITVKIKELSETFEPILKSQIELTTSSTESFNKFLKNISEIDKSLATYGSSLTRQLEQFDKIDQSFITLDENLRKVSDSASLFLGNSSESISKFSTNLELISGKMGDLDNSISGMKEAFSSVKISMDNLGPSTEKATALIDNLNNKQSELAERVKASQEMVADTHSELLKALRRITQEIQ